MTTKLETQQYISKLESNVADLRKRNGELSEALRDCSPEEWDKVTRLEVQGGAYRANRIEKVASQAVLWFEGTISDEDLESSIQYLIDYLPEWHRMQREAFLKGQRALKTRLDNLND